MSHHIGQVHVRKQKGRIVVTGYGQTPRGLKFIRQQKALTVTETGAKNFKGELATVVEEMLAQEPFEGM